MDDVRQWHRHSVSHIVSAPSELQHRYVPSRIPDRHQLTPRGAKFRKKAGEPQRLVVRPEVYDFVWVKPVGSNRIIGAKLSRQPFDSELPRTPRPF